jgi:hypothetical protein
MAASDPAGTARRNAGGLATLDAYTRRARLAPALLAAFPVLTALVASARSPQTTVRLIGLAGGAVGLVVCGMTRDRGRRLEPDLWASWGGSPTLRRLRWHNAPDTDAVHRLHQRLNTLLDEPLPDAAAEASDPDAADGRYDEAVTALRERTRDPARFRLVFAENTEYGFRRNSLGLRPLAIGIATLVLALSLTLAIGVNSHRAWTRWGVTAAVTAGTLGFWWRIVTPAWVRTAAELYADRLLEALETLRSSP